jgi:hypothetical protein
MKTIKHLHHSAMESVDPATRASLAGDHPQAESLLREAFRLEREAADLCANDLALEPTRSVLHRSAASLALECKEFREAERLVARALVGNPPDEIADELRDLLEQVHFERHLKLRGVTVEPEELQVSLAGKNVGFGIVRMEEFVGRAQAIERLVYRTAERRLGLPYRETGSPSAELVENFEMFVSVPRAASFSVSLRVGRPERSVWLPGYEALSGAEVVEEIIGGLEDLNRGDDGAVHRRIPGDAYYRNFVGLARRIAPDGSEVRMVGLTLIRQGAQREITLTKRRKQLPSTRAPQPAQDSVIVTGTLLYADATAERAGKIKLIDDERQEHVVIVPEGMMNDIVRPLWNIRVIVEGTRMRSGIYLDDIQAAASERGAPAALS